MKYICGENEKKVFVIIMLSQIPLIVCVQKRGGKESTLRATVGRTLHILARERMLDNTSYFLLPWKRGGRVPKQGEKKRKRKHARIKRRGKKINIKLMENNMGTRGKESRNVSNLVMVDKGEKHRGEEKERATTTTY